MPEPAHTADRGPTISPKSLEGVTCHNNGVKFLNGTGSWRGLATYGGAEADHCWCGGIIVLTRLSPDWMRQCSRQARS
jgi:hypothetical protein